MNHTGRGVIGATRKRKDRDYNQDASFYSPKQIPIKGNFGNSHKPHQQQQHQLIPPSPNTTSSNHLLAGYMAHEFLTRGTLFGQIFDPARAEAVPVSAADHKRKPGLEPGKGNNNNKPEAARFYGDVAQLLKSDVAHIPGIVNPTQLARWIQM